jgi:hypothetical protein
MTEDSGASKATWSEIGDQFQALGETIADTLKAAWERDETREHVASLQAGLEGLVSHVERAINEFGESEEAQRLQAEAKKAAGSARAAGEKAWEDARPHVLSALQQVNDELRKVTSRIEGSGATAASSAAETE